MQVSVDHEDQIIFRNRNNLEPIKQPHAHAIFGAIAMCL